jgi:hypothetical protein
MNSVFKRFKKELCEEYRVLGYNALQSVESQPMEAMWSYETSVDLRRTARHYIPEDYTLPNHRCENLKFYKNVMALRSTGAEIEQSV